MSKSIFQQLKQQQGQTSLIMILVFALGLVFFAVTLNWGKVSQTKSQTIIAANAGASMSASIYASSAQQLWQTYLRGGFAKGQPGMCGKSNILSFLVGVVIAVVAVVLAIVTWGATSALAIAAMIGLVFAVTALMLQTYVVQPGMLSMWNKLWKNLQPDAFYVEQGIAAAAPNIVTDTVLVPDIFDSNQDAEFFGSVRRDTTSRYGFFYTERLKMLQPPPIDGIQSFISEMNALAFGDPSKNYDCADPANAGARCCLATPYKPYGCADWIMSDAPCTDMTDARCNSCCVPADIISTREVFRQGTVTTYTRYRPGECASTPYSTAIPGTSTVQSRLASPDSAVPVSCLGNSNPYAADYPYVYQPFYQNYQNENFTLLKFLGHDGLAGTTPDGNTAQMYIPPTGDDPANPGLYDFAPAGIKPAIRGDIFPMLWNMKDKLAIPVADNTITELGITLDSVVPMTDFVAGDAECPNTLDERTATSVSTKWWKPYKDGLCGADSDDTMWPYGNCNEIRFNGSRDRDGNFIPRDIKCEAWHDDLLDMVSDDALDFLDFAKTSANKPIDEINRSFVAWYPEAAKWIAPKCNVGCAEESTDIACNPSVCSANGEGVFRQWRQAFGGSNGNGGFYKVFNDWITQPATATNSFCVPDNITADMPLQEASLYAPIDGIEQGYLQKVDKCLNFYKTADAAFKQCQDQCSQEACNQLPRSFVSGFNPNDPTARANMPTTATEDATTSMSLGEIYNQIAGLPPGDPQITILEEAIARIYAGTSCEPTSGYMVNINQSYNLAVAYQPHITQRANVVHEVVSKAIKARDEFKKAYNVFDAFLGVQGACEQFDSTDEGCTKAPAYQLMQTRRNYDQSTDNANNFIVYGWKGSKQTTSKGDTIGNDYWHMMRIEVKLPKRCQGPAGLCITDNVPWIQGKGMGNPQLAMAIDGITGGMSFVVHILGAIFDWGIFSKKICYFLRDYNGRVLVRVTRWDESSNDRDDRYKKPLNFANNVKLWDFRSGNPNRPKRQSDESIAAMENKCAGILNEQPPLGLTQDTWDAINTISIDDDAKDKFNNAFMINLLRGDARSSVNRNAALTDGTNPLEREQECLAIVDKFLRRGVTTQACAQYYFRYDQYRMAVKFVDCPANAFKNEQTDHMPIR